jgi:GNAT superfamily N-acetyltransferase
MTDDTIDLRRAVPEDAPAILALTRAAYAKWVPVIGREPKPMTADYDAAVQHHLIDLIEAAKGGIAALIETIPETGSLLIENLAVAPDHQGRGYGKLLMDHAERLAASLGIPRTRLYTNKRFVENLNFYHRLGYAVDCEEAFKGGFIVHMSKTVRAD